MSGSELAPLGATWRTCSMLCSIQQPTGQTTTTTEPVYANCVKPRWIHVQPTPHTTSKLGRFVSCSINRFVRKTQNYTHTERYNCEARTQQSTFCQHTHKPFRACSVWPPPVSGQHADSVDTRSKQAQTHCRCIVDGTARNISACCLAVEVCACVCVRTRAPTTVEGHRVWCLIT
jgi:hypothetical protein